MAVIVNGRGLGWKKDPAKLAGETPDRLAAPRLRALPPPPVSASCAQYILDILDQGQLGSCTCNAFTQALRAAMVRAGAKAPELAARLFLYFLARAYDHDTANDDGVKQGNETRGAFSWIASAAQALYPVDPAFRTPAAQIYADTLANFGETPYLALCRSSYKQRHGPFRMAAFLGVDLKAQFTNFTKYIDNVANKTPVRQFRQDASSEALIITMDKLTLDTGEVDLHLTSFNRVDANTGADTAYTHTSGIQVDLDMAGLAYTRMPRVVKLPYQGGGQKAIVDAIFLHMIDNPLGGIAMNINS